MNLERLEGAIQNDYGHLDQTIRDWAKWDDTYAFVQDANQGIVGPTCSPPHLQTSMCIGWYLLARTAELF